MKTIALIDDDPLFAKYFSIKVSTAGVDVNHFHTVREFLETSDPTYFDGVLVDLNMEDASGVTWAFAGLQAVNEIRRSAPKSPPIAILTAHSNFLLAASSSKNGADIYLEKECSPGEVLEMLSGVERPPLHDAAIEPQASAL